MFLKQRMADLIVERLGGDLEQQLVGNFDMERRADKLHHSRRAAYGVAYGVFGDLPGSPIQGDEKAWELVLRMFEILCDFQREDGAWDWYIESRGKTYTCGLVWALYSFIRVLADFGEHVPAPLRERVATMVRKATEPRLVDAKAFLETGRHKASKNIFAHSALELWAAGPLFSEPEWTAVAAEALERVVSMQFPDGYWPDANDHRGPTVAYDQVTLQAVSNYALLSGSEAALEAVRRGAEFHRWLSYPDGSCVETIDERNRYGGKVREGLIWTLAPFEATRGVAALTAERLASFEPAEPHPLGGVIGPIAVDAWQATPDEDVAATPPPEGERVFGTIPAAVMRRRPWQVCLSGATTQVPSRTYHHDLQNHFSAWRDAAGLLIGGGNALLDPRFSTFRFQGLYLADAGETETIEDGLRLRLRYGEITATLEVRLVEDDALQLDVRAEGDLPPDSEFAFHLRGLFGETVRFGEDELPLTDWAFWRGFAEDVASFTVGPVTVTTPPGMLLMWPCRPMFIYDPPALLELEQAVLRVSVGLAEGPARITVRVEDVTGG